MPYAELADYEALFGDVPAPDEARVTAWLSSVSAVIASRLGSSTPDVEVARFVVCSVVQRILANPTGIRTSQAGGTSVTYAMVGTLITPEEWDMLTGAAVTTGAYTVDLVDEVYRPQPNRYYPCDGWVPR